MTHLWRYFGLRNRETPKPHTILMGFLFFLRVEGLVSLWRAWVREWGDDIVVVFNGTGHARHFNPRKLHSKVQNRPQTLGGFNFLANA